MDDPLASNYLDGVFIPILWATYQLWNCAGNFYLPICCLPTSHQLPFCPSQDRCNIINTTLGFLTQKVKLETFNTILIGVLMKNSNNLPVTGVVSPPGKIKVAWHSTVVYFYFFPSFFCLISFFYSLCIISSCRMISVDLSWGCKIAHPFVCHCWDVHWATKLKSWIGVASILSSSLSSRNLSF